MSLAKHRHRVTLALASVTTDQPHKRRVLGGPALDGETELETSDGEIRRVPDGSLVLAEDIHGKGHVSRHPKEGQRGSFLFPCQMA